MTHRVPLSRAAEAFALLDSRPPGLERLVVETGADQPAAGAY